MTLNGKTPHGPQCSRPCEILLRSLFSQGQPREIEAQLLLYYSISQGKPLLQIISSQNKFFSFVLFFTPKKSTKRRAAADHFQVPVSSVAHALQLAPKKKVGPQTVTLTCPVK